jgi:cyclic pyranopterin phosphate synthase
VCAALPILRIDPSGRRPPPAPAAARAAGQLLDSHGRVIRDLRLSVTDRCNYRCVYCMDPDHRYLPKRELLTLDEYLKVAAACAALGIRKIRVTGGEPTLYPYLEPLIEGISALAAAAGRPGFEDVAMTSNGSLVTAEKARRWRELGLRRITYSLDSLRPERAQAITRSDATPEGIVAAIEAARAAGLEPIRVNAVVLRGVNEDEVADFADFARGCDIDMRLIEFMPLDSSRGWKREDVVSADEMLAAIRARHDLVPLGRDDEHGTALNFGFGDGTRARIGIIAPVTRPFCGACSRLRITADGKVRPCLFSREEWDLRPLLRDGATREDVARFITDSMWTKQAGHGIGHQGFVQPIRGMSAIGG